VVGAYKECIPMHAQLWGEFRDMLNDEFAPVIGALGFGNARVKEALNSPGDRRGIGTG
jgi:hypothetical protein